MGQTNSLQAESASGFTATGDMTVHGNAYCNQNIYTGSSSPLEKITGFVNVDSPKPNFTGRAALLQTIHERFLEASKKTDYADRIVILHGLGGIGKSELARKYAHTHLDSPIIKNIAWIDAESEASLEASFLALAKRLGLHLDNLTLEKVEKIAEIIYEYFSANIGTGLFIFDNALQMNSVDKNFGILNYLPTQILRRRPLVLITTRNSEWGGIPRENKIPVNELINEEAIEFLVKAFQLTAEQQADKEDMAAVQNLAHNLQGFPLGLTLATSNIRNTVVSAMKDEIHSYLKRMAAPKGGWLDDDLSTDDAIKYNRIMKNVWTDSFKKIESLEGKEGEIPLKLLNLMAYLPTDDITPERVIAIYKYLFKEECTKKYFLILAKFSLITIQASSDSQPESRIRIHRLVQHCTREKFDRDTNYRYLFGICDYLIHHSNSIYNIEYWTSIHNHLSNRGWPKESIRYSVLFSSKILQTEEYYWYLDNVWMLVQDIDEHLKKTGGFSITEDVELLFNLVFFYFQTHKNWPFCELEMLKEPELVGKLEGLFCSAVHGYLKYLLSPNNEVGLMDPLSLSYFVRKEQYQMCNEILTCVSHQLRKELLEKLNITDFLITSIHSGNRGWQVETSSRIFMLIWSHRFNSVVPISPTSCVQAVTKMHTQLFHLLEVTPSEEIAKYWEFGGPFTHGHIVVKLSVQEKYSDWNELFSDSFFKEGGPGILAQHLIVLNSISTDWWKISSLLGTIRHLAYDLNGASKFVESSEFMESFYSYTRKHLPPLSTERTLGSIPDDCIIAWFALFAKNTAMVDNCGRVWSIHSVTGQLKLLLEERTWVVKNAYYNSTDIFKTFLTTAENKRDTVAFQFATRIVNPSKGCILA